jgi:putative phage-type endonuclease
LRHTPEHETMSVAELSPRETWLAERRTGIGASDAAAVLGVSPYKSAFELWAEKTGFADADSLDGKEHVEWGLRLERPIAEAFAERTGRDVSLRPQFYIQRHPSLPWMLATPDAEDDTGRLVQIKTCNAFLAREWEVEPPLPYQIQVQHEMAVTGAERATLVVLIGGQKLKWFDLDRNERFIDAMTPKLAAFWEAVLTKAAPEVDGSAATARVLAKLHPNRNGEAVTLNADCAEWAAQLEAAKAKIKAAEVDEQWAKNRLIAAIGDASIGVLPDGARYSLTTQTRKEHVVKESTFPVLRRLK